MSRDRGLSQGVLFGLIMAGLLPAMRVILAGVTRKPSSSAAVHSSDPASSLDAGAYGATRNAGPASMRDDNSEEWDKVDEASDESFPASDPPANY